MTRTLSFPRQLLIIGILSLVLLGLIAAGVEGVPAPLPMLRLLLGLPFVLFFPGYALQAAIFTRAGDLDGPERLALSFGLSVAVIPPLALILDRLPWGIRLWPIVASEGLFTVVCLAIAWLRLWRLPEAERFRVDVQIDAKGWWAALDRPRRIAYGVLAGSLCTALIAASVIIFVPNPGDSFTEFYVLGPEGLAENYPREAAAGQPLTVTVGIANREGETAGYVVELYAGDSRIGGAGPIMLGDDEVWEEALEYALPQAGDDQQVAFQLYRDGSSEVYRSLRLWIDVTEAEPS